MTGWQARLTRGDTRETADPGVAVFQERGTTRDLWMTRRRNTVGGPRSVPREKVPEEE